MSRKAASLLGALIAASALSAGVFAVAATHPAAAQHRTAVVASDAGPESLTRL